jgi:hypothetical protein
VSQEKREAIVIYLDLIHEDTLNDLTSEQLGTVFMAALKHGKGEDISGSLDPMSRLVFRQLRDGIDRAWENYNAICARNRVNGKKGGRPRKVDNRKPTVTDNNPPVTDRNPEKPTGYFGFQNETDQNPNNPTHTHTHATATAKDITVFTTNIVSSKDGETGNRPKPTETQRNPPVTDRNPEKPTGYFGLSDDEDAWPPDYDPAEGLGEPDLQDDSTESDDSEEDRPF